jgi:hypothetical protein
LHHSSCRPEYSRATFARKRSFNPPQPIAKGGIPLYFNARRTTRRGETGSLHRLSPRKNGLSEGGRPRWSGRQFKFVLPKRNGVSLRGIAISIPRVEWMFNTPLRPLLRFVKTSFSRRACPARRRWRMRRVERAISTPQEIVT